MANYLCIEMIFDQSTLGFQEVCRMAMRSATRMVVALLLLMTAFMLGGCLGTIKPDTKQRGTMTIIAKIPDQFRSPAKPTASSVDTRITNLVFTVSRGSTTINKSVPVVDGTVEVEFADLLVGTWQIDVVGKNADGLDIATATSSAYIKSGKTSLVTLEMKLATGSLSVTVEFESSCHITSGTVTLLNPIEGSIERDLEIRETSGSALFEDVAAITWPIRVALYTSDGSLAAYGEDQVTVAPGDTTYATIVLRNGTMIVSITWKLPPSAPAGLRAAVQDGRVLLSWTANPPSENVAGYLVYRSTDDSSPLSLVSDNLITGTSYEDLSALLSPTLQYSVQAYSSDGLSGNLSPRVTAASQQNVLFLPDLTIVKSGVTNTWQMSFRAEQPDGLVIVDASVTTPSGITEPMVPDTEYPEVWYAFWHLSAPEPGVYTQSVEYSTGQREVLMTVISMETFTRIELPELIAPSNGAVLHTVTPILEYRVPAYIDSISIAVNDIAAGTNSYFPCGPESFQIPEGVLQPGRKYRWVVTTYERLIGGPLLRGVSARWSFDVQ